MERREVLIGEQLARKVDAKRGDRALSSVVRELLAKWVGDTALASARGRGRPRKER